MSTQGGASGTSDRDVDALFDRAMSAAASNQLDEAKELLAQVVNLDPTHEQAWMELAGVTEDLAEAQACLRKVLGLNPNNAQAREWLSFAEMEDAGEAPALARMQEANEAPGPARMQEADEAPGPARMQEADEAPRPARMQEANEAPAADQMIAQPETPALPPASARAPAAGNRPVAQLGRYLVESNLITEEQLAAGLAAQEEERQAGTPRKIGEILVEQGALSEDLLLTALHEQHKDFGHLFHD